jgi:hypothetical protein
MGSMKVTHAGQIFKNAQCIDFRRLVRSNNVFDKKAFELVKDAAKRSNNTAGIWVHPLFFSDCLNNGAAAKVSNNLSVQKAVSIESYAKYLDNNLKSLREDPDRPHFIFYDTATKIDLANQFLGQNDDIRNPLIFVQTETADPTPNIFNRKRPALIKYLEGLKATGDALMAPVINEALVYGPGSDLYDFVANCYNGSSNFRGKYYYLDSTFIANRERSLDLLKNTFLDLGMESFMISGEKGFSVMNGDGGTTDSGCVFSLYYKLMNMDLNCTLDMDMVFPGVTVTKG